MKSYIQELATFKVGLQNSVCRVEVIESTTNFHMPERQDFYTQHEHYMLIQNQTKVLPASHLDSYLSLWILALVCISLVTLYFEFSNCFILLCVPCCFPTSLLFVL